MNGSLALDISLVCHANAFLDGRIDAANLADFFERGRMTESCEFIHFVNLSRNFFLFGPQKISAAASSPMKWFVYLKSKGCRGLVLAHSPGKDPRFSDRNLTAFVGGGGTWMLLASMPVGRGEMWVNRWEIGDKNHPQRKIWRVTYARMMNDFVFERPKDSLETAYSQLKNALHEISSFARAQNEKDFLLCFQSALNDLDFRNSPANESRHWLFPPQILSPKAEATLNAAESAWVFGGMGSWNDLYCEQNTQSEYERVSEGLYLAIVNAIVASVNDSFLAERPLQ